MSDCNYTVFPPLDYGAMGTTDVDSSFVMDCTINLQARNDTIASIGTPVVTRSDGETLTSADLTVPSVSVIVGNLQFKWTLKSNGNVATYVVDFPINLVSGSVISRAIVVRTLPAIG